MVEIIVMEKKTIVTTVKGKTIKDYKKEYWKNYKTKNKRIILTLPNKMYVELKQQSKELKQSIPEYIRTKIDSQIHKSTPPELKEQLKEISFLLRNATNNINQIAYNLNVEALETGHVDITKGAKTLLNIYTGIEKLETIITSYIQEKIHDYQINEQKNTNL